MNEVPQPHPIPEDLRHLFQCPVCAGSLDFSRDDQIRCTACDRIYPIRDGIPDFVPDDMDEV